MNSDFSPASEAEQTAKVEYQKTRSLQEFAATQTETGAEFVATQAWTKGPQKIGVKPTVFVFTPEQIQAGREEMEQALARKAAGELQENEPVFIYERKPNFVIMINGQEQEYSNEPLCTYEQLMQAYKLVERNLPELLEGLDIDDAWGAKKLTHELVVAAGKSGISTEMKRAMQAENYALLNFLGMVHDLGRAIDSKIRSGKELTSSQQAIIDNVENKSNHGEISASALRKWRVSNLFNPETREIVEYAIIHHSDKSTPVLESNSETDRIKHLITTVLRDKDKIGLFLGKTDKYLYDLEEIKNQCEKNNLAEPTGQITPSVLETFENNEAIDRNGLVSYEDFMLQYLAWIFDINTQAGMQEAIECGFIEKMLQWFKEKVKSEEDYQRIKKATYAFVEKQGAKIA